MNKRKPSKSEIFVRLLYFSAEIFKESKKKKGWGTDNS